MVSPSAKALPVVRVAALVFTPRRALTAVPPVLHASMHSFVHSFNTKRFVFEVQSAAQSEPVDLTKGVVGDLLPSLVD